MTMLSPNIELQMMVSQEQSMYLEGSSQVYMAIKAPAPQKPDCNKIIFLFGPKSPRLLKLMKRNICTMTLREIVNRLNDGEKIFVTPKKSTL